MTLLPWQRQLAACWRRKGDRFDIGIIRYSVPNSDTIWSGLEAWPKCVIVQSQCERIQESHVGLECVRTQTWCETSLVLWPCRTLVAPTIWSKDKIPFALLTNRLKWTFFFRRRPSAAEASERQPWPGPWLPLTETWHLRCCYYTHLPSASVCRCVHFWFRECQPLISCPQRMQMSLMMTG